MQQVTATEVKRFKRSIHLFCFGYTLLRPFAVSARECVGHAREAHKQNIVLNRTYERIKNRKENRFRDFKLVVRRINCLTGKLSRAVADVRSQTPSQGPIHTTPRSGVATVLTSSAPWKHTQEQKSRKHVFLFGFFHHETRRHSSQLQYVNNSKFPCLI